MQHLFNEIEKIVTKNEKIIDLLRYILLFVASLMMYAKFSSFGNFDNTIVLTLIIIVFVLMMIKPLLGVLVLGLGLAITLAFSNVILGLMVLGLFLIMAFGLSYYDNDLIFVSLVMIMIASPFGFISAMALGMIAILFVQRGIGIPFIVSLFYVSFHLFDKRLFPLDLIHLNHETITLNDVLEKLNQVLVIDAAQNFDKAFIVFKENATLLIATVFIIYIAMRIIMTKKEKETVFQKELKNSVFSVSILTVSLLIVRIMAMLMLKKEIVMVDLLLDILSVLIGMLLAFMASCFIKRYPLSPVNPYEKVQEEKEKAKLMEVVKESDAKDLKYT